VVLPISPGLQQVLLFWKTGFVQALGVALIPVETPAQKQALGRPRDIFGRHDVAALAPQVGAVTQDSQPGKAAPGGMTDQDAGQPQSQLARQQEDRWLRHHASGGECGNGRRTQFVGGPQQGFERIGHGLTLLRLCGQADQRRIDGRHRVDEAFRVRDHDAREL
jgi:hypothetical protein